MTTLLALSCAWLIGVIAGALLPGGRPELAGPTLGLAVAAGVALGLGWRERRVRWGAAYLLVALLGLARTFAALPPVVAPPGSLGSYNVPAAVTQGAPAVTVRGIVREEPYLNNAHTSLLVPVDVEAIQQGDAWQPAPGGLLALAGRFSPAHRGDRVSVTGVLQDAPSFPDFDYRGYLLRQDLGSYMRYAQITILEKGADAGLLPALEGRRRDAGDRLAQELPEPQAGLLRGIILGQAHALDPNLHDAFAITGTLHIVAISGTNITMIVGAIFFVARRRLSPKLAATLAIILIVLYTLFVGAEASVVRAAIMGSIYLIAQAIGRPAHTSTLLAATALTMTLYDSLLVLDVGFQLSFAAMAGLILLAPRLLARLHRLRLRLLVPGVREIVAATVAAELFTDPLLAYHFGYMPVIGTLANLLVEPTLPLIMILGGLAIGPGAIWAPMGQVLAWACWAPLTWMIGVVEELAQGPWLPMPEFGAVGLIAWYGLLGLALGARTDVGRQLRADFAQRWREGLRLRRAETPSLPQEND